MFKLNYKQKESDKHKKTSHIQSLKNKNNFLTPARSLALGFLGVIFIGAFLLSTPIAHENRQWFSFVDALFTATSAVCVTGLAVVDTALHFSMFGEIVIILLIQIGGLGFMATATAMFILIGKKIGLKDRMVIQESLSETALRGLVVLIKKVLMYTFVFEIFGAILISFTLIPKLGWGQGIYKSIFLAISSFCNAGFDLFGSNFGAFAGLAPFATDAILCLTVSFLIIVGGIGFAVISDITSTKSPKKYKSHTKVVLVTTGALILSGTLFFLIAEYNNPMTIGGMGFGDKLLNSFFQAVTPRTAGFATVNQANLTSPSVFMTTVLMFIGASPASTGGGIKTTTFIILLLSLWNSMRGRDEIVVNKKSISHKVTIKAFSIISFAMVLILMLTVSLAIFERNNPMKEIMTLENMFFESVSAFATVGLSKGITPYLSVMSKLLVSLVMFAGRVGPINLGWALMQKISKEKSNIKYPSMKLLVG